MARRDDDAFTAFAAGSGGRLRRTAYLLCGDWQLAADIVQEALIKVYVAWPRLDTGGGLATYARKVVVSVAIDMHRKKSSTELPSEMDPELGGIDRHRAVDRRPRRSRDGVGRPCHRVSAPVSCFATTRSSRSPRRPRPSDAAKAT